jgi:hypothetical protein
MTRRNRDFQIDEIGVRRTLDNGSVVHLAWRNLVEVALVTVDQGPFAEDLFFVLGDANGNYCVLPSAFAAALLPRLQRLPGFDNRQVQRAADCVDPAHFVCWRGMPGQAVVCA